MQDNNRQSIKGGRRRKRLVFVQGAASKQSCNKRGKLFKRTERGGAPEMWAGLSLLLALCLLHGGGAESEGGGPRCQPAAAWKIGEVDPMKESTGRASKLDGLHKKLQGQGLTDVVFMVVNHQGEQAQRLHPLLQERLSQDIALYKQHKHQPDVWQILNGEKDDFFIYDRCGRLTHHLSLPYNIIGHGHVERAIREAYCNRMCGEVLTFHLSVKEKRRHNLKQMLLKLAGRSINISILITAILVTTVITKVFVLVASATTTTADMVITIDTTTTMVEVKPSRTSACRNTSITCSNRCS
ncbi:Selenoprotein Pa [Oryzias melastigma]|uniref:Selenoprotein Pa n=1 Tax=Oryzias melastigma TaxID=30732 RepID=A0A834CHM0_ORYME|nr:Selenoprotein Pa [Oryzias melastigma]